MALMNSTPSRSITSSPSRSHPLLSPRSAFKRCMEGTSDVDPILACTALLNCVVACGASDSDLKIDSLLKLANLLDVLDKAGAVHDGLNFVRVGDDEKSKKISGTPLYLAAKLNLPEAAELLMGRGASMVHRWNGLTPIEIAIEKKSTDVLVFFYDKIRELEGGPVANLDAKLCRAEDTGRKLDEEEEEAAENFPTKKRKHN